MIEEKLIRIFEKLIDSGAENINLVNPTHYALQLKALFSKWKCPVPLVYNCGGYESVETLQALNGIVDIYLPDFKYIRQDKAKKYSRAGGLSAGCRSRDCRDAASATECGV